MEKGWMEKDDGWEDISCSLFLAMVEVKPNGYFWRA